MVRFAISTALVFLFLGALLPTVAGAGDLPPDYRKGAPVLVTMEEQVNPRHTAVVIVDMQNDFVYGKGRLTMQEGPGWKRCEEIITPMNAFIDKARKMGVPIIYTFTVHGGEFDLPPYKASKIRNDTAPVCLKGSKGGEFAAKLNRPQPGDAVVTKHGYDAFVDSDINTLLQNRGIKTLVFGGIDSAVCVDTNIRHAFHLGYYAIFASDICASPDPDRHTAAIKLIQSQYGFVTTTPEVMKIWDMAK